MAAQEYYLGTQGVHELPGNQLHSSYVHQPPPQQIPPYQSPPMQPYSRPHHNDLSYSNTPPPTYSAVQPLPPQQVQPPAPQRQDQYAVQKPPYQYPPEKSQHQYQYPSKGLQAVPQPPYPQTPPASYYSPPQHQKSGYFGPALQPVRSHSQPARVRFADQVTDHSTELGEPLSSSSSDDASPRRHTPRRDRDRDRDHTYTSESSDSSEREREREPSRRPRKPKPHHRHHHHHHHQHKESRTQQKEHKNRDTFLGAGAGTIIGDALFPGLGTAAGLLLGGYGGRKYAEQRSQSEEPSGRGWRGDSHGEDGGAFQGRRRR